MMEYHPRVYSRACPAHPRGEDRLVRRMSETLIKTVRARVLVLLGTGGLTWHGWITFPPSSQRQTLDLGVFQIKHEAIVAFHHRTVCDSVFLEPRRPPVE